VNGGVPVGSPVRPRGDRSAFERAAQPRDMVNESRTFGLVALLTLAGLGVMLYGVSLNSGQALNGPVIAGGVILVVAVAVLTAGLDALADGDAEAEA